MEITLSVFRAIFVLLLGFFAWITPMSRDNVCIRYSVHSTVMWYILPLAQTCIYLWVQTLKQPSVSHKPCKAPSGWYLG